MFGVGVLWARKTAMYTIGNIYEVPTQIRSLSLTKRIAASGNVIVAIGNLGARLG